jgi:hypothetical protein
LRPVSQGDNHSGAYPLASTSDGGDELKQYYLKSRVLLGGSQAGDLHPGPTELWRNKIDRKAFFKVPYPQVYDESKHEFHT